MIGLGFAVEVTISVKSAGDERGYSLPNFRIPLNADATRASISRDATVKGFYFNALLRELGEQGHHLTDHKRYRDFGDYPVASAFDLILVAVRRLYPSEPAREGIRRIAWSMFPFMLETMVGRVLFGALGNDMLGAFKHASRGFEVSLSKGRCEVTALKPGHIELSVTNFQLLPDCFLLGVFEGTLAHYGCGGEVFIRPGTKPQDAQYLLRWQ